MLGAECTYRLLPTPWRRSSVAAVIADSAPPTRSRYCSPAALRRTPCALRSNRRTPRCVSRRATWWLIAEAVRCSSAAARAKLRRRATASKASRLATGGIAGIG